MTAQPTRDRLRALVDETSPGPWESILSLAWGEQYPALSIQPVDEAWDQDPAHPCCAPLEEADVEFIAAARTAVPQLLDQLDAAEARIRHLEDTARVLVKEALEAEDKRDNHRRAKVEAEEKIKAVRELHEPQMVYRLIDGEDFAQEPDGDVCVVCREYYPCDTILALDAARRDEEKR